jgi:hypothetical protein
MSRNMLLLIAFLAGVVLAPSVHRLPVLSKLPSI